MQNSPIQKFKNLYAESIGFDPDEFSQGKITVHVKPDSANMIYVFDTDDQIVIFVGPDVDLERIKNITFEQWQNYFVDKNYIEELMGRGANGFGPFICAVRDIPFVLESSRSLTFEKIDPGRAVSYEPLFNTDPRVLDALQPDEPDNGWSQAGISTARYSQGAYLLRDNGRDAALGIIHNFLDQPIDTGVITLPDMRRNGYGTRILQEMSNQILVNAPIHLVRYRPANRGSAGLSRELNFNHVGVMHEAIVNDLSRLLR